MGIFGLKVELRAIRAAINELRETIKQHSEAISAAEKRDRNEQSRPQSVNAVVSFDDQAKADEKAEYDRQYRVQNSIRWAAWLAFGAATIYAGIAAITYFQIAKQYPKLAESADAAQKAADAAVSGLRPWIKITDVQTRGEGPVIPALDFQSFPMLPKSSQATFQLQISLKNIGHSPARLTTNFELFLPLWGNGYSDVIYQEKRRFCSDFAKKGMKVDPGLQIILFPDEPHDWDGGASAIVDSKVISHVPQIGPNPYVLLMVPVCVNYQFGDSPTVYQTSALCEVFRKDNRSRFFDVGKNVPASGILMIRNIASDDSY